MGVEIAVICPSDAVIHPRAMMVVSFNALVADIAMSTLRQTYHSTEGAQTFWVESLK